MSNLFMDKLINYMFVICAMVKNFILLCKNDEKNVYQQTSQFMH